jgi:hypothetical protein
MCWANRTVSDPVGSTRTIRAQGWETLSRARTISSFSRRLIRADWSQTWEIPFSAIRAHPPEKEGMQTRDWSFWMDDS